MEKMVDFGSDLKTSYSQYLSELKKLMPFLFDLNGNLNLKAFENFVKEYKEIEPSKFEFTWSGKEKAQKLAFEEYKEGTLEADGKRGKSFHETSNIVIEGENLQVLHLLRKSYKGKIKCIYIDPPYNTGNDFVYNDKFELDIKSYLIESGQIDGETGEKLVDYITKDDGKKHSKWLSFMYPRLLLARDLLTEDGVIFVSIDDNEQANLKLLMTEIFGEENFVGQFIWQKTYSPKNNNKYISEDHEYIFCFSKSLDTIERFNRLDRTEKNDDLYRYDDNDGKGKYRLSDLTIGDKKGYDIKWNGKIFREPPTRGWGFSEKKMYELIKEGRIYLPEDETKRPSYKRYLSEVDGIISKTILPYELVGHTDSSKKELDKLIGVVNIFDYPKPVALIKHLLKISTKPNDIVLDFFAGSGTTGQAVMELNSEEVEKKKKEGMITDDSMAGRRKFILVQLPEKIDQKKEAFKAGFKFISDITIERVLRVSEKYKGIDNGFKVFKLLHNPKYDEYDIEAVLKKVDSFILNLIAINYGYGLNYKCKALSFGKFYEITSEFEERKALVILEDEILSNEKIAQLIKLSEEGNYTLFAKESALNIEIIYNLCNYFKKENIIRV